MAFNIENFKEMGGPGNSKAGGQAYAVFSGEDDLLTMMATGYLNGLSETLNARDMIYLSAVDGGRVVQIASNISDVVSVVSVFNGGTVQNFNIGDSSDIDIQVAV